jgi:hypothetical protein
MTKRIVFFCIGLLISINILVFNSRVQASDIPAILYHYTSEAGYTGILASKVINPSLQANNPKDARYGDGQYFSDIEPGTRTPAQLSKEFINIPFQGKKFLYYIGVKTAGLNVLKGREHVFVVVNNSPLDISKRLASHGQN